MDWNEIPDSWLKDMRPDKRDELTRHLVQTLLLTKQLHDLGAVASLEARMVEFTDAADFANMLAASAVHAREQAALTTRMAEHYEEMGSLVRGET